MRKGMCELLEELNKYLGPIDKFGKSFQLDESGNQITMVPSGLVLRSTSGEY